MSGFTADDPTVLAYSLPDSVTKIKRFRPYRKSWFVPCEFCRRLHAHGAPEGHRVAHCPQQNDIYRHLFEGRERPRGYHLKYAGEAAGELLSRIKKEVM